MTNPTTSQTEPTQEALDMAFQVRYIRQDEGLRAVADFIQAALDKREAETLERAAEVAKRNLYHQTEKVEDAKNILRQALGASHD